MNVRTYDLVIWFRGYHKVYYNVSRVAVKRFVDWYRENPDFERFAMLAN